MIIATIRGGLGNQLFMYAYARCLSIKYRAPLFLDVYTGFRRDYFGRQCGLSHFHTKGQYMSAPYILTFCHIIKKVALGLYKQIPYEKRRLIIEEGASYDFDPRLLTAKPRKKLYLFGYWQNEKYFRQIAPVIREELKIVTPHDPANIQLAAIIKRSNAVCLHYRRHDRVHNRKSRKTVQSGSILTLDYYAEAMKRISRNLSDPHFFCFSDYPEWLEQNLKTDFPITFVTNNKGDEKSYEDFWLMTLCKHFIIANSTFSWWAAWLGSYAGKRVLAPDPGKYFGCAAIPQRWEVIPG